MTAFVSQESFLDPVSYLWWRFLEKSLPTINFLQKSSIIDVWQGCKYTSEVNSVKTAGCQMEYLSVYW